MPDSLARLTGMKKIDLQANQLSGSLPSSLASLCALKLLSACENMLSGKIPDAMVSMQLPFDSWVVNTNRLSGAIPVVVMSLPRLKMASTHIATSCLGAYQNSRLPDLVVSGNRLTGTLPAFKQRTFADSLTQLVGRNAAQHR